MLSSSFPLPFLSGFPSLSSVGSSKCSLLSGIPTTSLEWVVAQAFRLGRVVDKEDQHNALMRHIVGKLSYALALADFSIIKGRIQINFDIPEDLRASWQLDGAKKN